MRISLGSLIQLPHHTAFQLRTSQQRLQQAFVFGRRKRLKLNRYKAAITLKTTEHAGNTMPLVDLRCSIRSRDHGWGRAKAANHILQRIQRNVSIVKVLEENQQWFAGADADKRAGQQIKNIGAILDLF